MDLLLEGYFQDLKRLEEEIERYYQEYLTLNQVFISDKKDYEQILLNYGTEELKFTLGFLTSIYKNIQQKKYSVIDSIFDTIEHSGEFELSIFYGNRILEKFKGQEADEYLIRLYTLRRMLNALLILDDGLEYLKYLIEYTKTSKEFFSSYNKLLKENYRNAMDFYQFIYVYYSRFPSDDEQALGSLIKSYNIKKLMIENQLLPYPEENNIFQIINIVGSYLQIENSFVSLVMDIDEYIKEFAKQMKDLKEFSQKSPSILELYLQQPFKRYINQFLTNIYIMGFDEEYHQVSQTFPEIITIDHKLIVEINEILVKDPSKERKLLSLKDEIERAFNNLSSDKKESVLYVYYNALISVFYDDIEFLKKIKKEIIEHKSRLKNAYSLDVPLFRILAVQGEKEKAKQLANQVREQAVISGKKFLVNAIDDYIKTELDV
ncbi:hypothetical protein [Persephonella sp. IF05-L8]|uniref:hypothetical protein n=1 Tax=Persephonella sp. IF05-L8 TaxID=1158338 RepID=UPI0004961684